MNQKIIDWTKEMINRYPASVGEKILDVGSLNVNGSVRGLFERTSQIKYVGIDFREGKEVDIVMDAHDITKRFKLLSFDTIICMNMLEHDYDPPHTLKQMNWVLKPGGYLYIVMPTIGFPIHDHPGDYWRATEEAFNDIFYKGYELLSMATIYTKEVDGKPVNPVLCAIGRKI